MEPTVRKIKAGTPSSYSINGEWTAEYAETCFKISEAIASGANEQAVLHCENLSRIDITGAWLLNRRIDALMRSGSHVSLEGFSQEHITFFERVGTYMHRPEKAEPPKPSLITRVNGTLHRYGEKAANVLIFTGWCIATLKNAVLHPSRFRFNAFVKQCEAAAVRAAPIVALTSFLIAIVTAYQGSAQLKRFGAEIFTVNLVTISGLREMAVLLTAIMLAGRSGSAFAAEIGAMKLNEEIDALKTTGLEPMEVLVLPRIAALVIMTPLLTFLSDIMSFLGAGLLSITSDHMNVLLYQSRLSEAIRMGDFWVGMSKAPVFGLLIGMVGCYHGMSVTGSAESVGRETTNAVVVSIFLVMLADAVFSVVFTVLGL